MTLVQIWNEHMIFKKFNLLVMREPSNGYEWFKSTSVVQGCWDEWQLGAAWLGAQRARELGGSLQDRAWFASALLPVAYNLHTVRINLEWGLLDRHNSALKCTFFLTGKKSNLRLREIKKRGAGHSVTAHAGVWTPAFLTPKSGPSASHICWCTDLLKYYQRFGEQ